MSTLGLRAWRGSKATTPSTPRAVTGRAYYQAKLDPDATLAGLLDVYRTAAARRASERPGSTVGA